VKNDIQVHHLHIEYHHHHLVVSVEKNSK
jgi:hypothetical protein